VESRETCGNIRIIDEQLGIQEDTFDASTGHMDMRINKWSDCSRCEAERRKPDVQLDGYSPVI
jgi:hypothetical protein